MHKLICSLAFALSLLLAGSASAQGVWNDGSASRLTHHCVLGIDLVDTWEDLTWTWVGFFGLPQVGQVYYARITVGGLGCSGAWGIPEVKLPRGTSFAISPSNPVRCYMKSASQSSRNQITDGTCPSEPFIGLYPDSNGSFPNPGGSGYSNQFFSFPPMTQPYWPLPPGTILTIEFPIISSQALSGFASNDYLLGAVNVLDNNPGGPTVQWDGHPQGYSGYGIPSSGAWQGVFVTQGPYSGPRIVYPEPSTQNITQSGGDTLVHVYNTSCLSQNVVNFELYPADDNEPDTTVFLGGSCTAIGDGGSSCSASWNGFQPDTLYKWRAKFLPGRWAPAPTWWKTTPSSSSRRRRFPARRVTRCSRPRRAAAPSRCRPSAARTLPALPSRPRRCRGRALRSCAGASTTAAPPPRTRSVSR